MSSIQHRLEQYLRTRGLPADQRQKSMFSVLTATATALVSVSILVLDLLIDTGAHTDGSIIAGTGILELVAVVFLIRINRQYVAGTLITLHLWVLPTAFIMYRGGLTEMSAAPLVLPVLFAAAGLDSKGLAATLTLCVATVVALSIGESYSLLIPNPTRNPPLLIHSISVISVLFLSAMFTEYGIRGVTNRIAEINREKDLLLQSEQRQQRQTQLAKEVAVIGHLLLEGDRLDVVSQEAALRLRKLLDADAILFGHFQDGVLLFLAQVGLESDLPALNPQETPGLTELLDSGQFCLIEDPNHWGPLVGPNWTGTGIANPITDGQTVSGAIFVLMSGSHTWDADQHAFLDAISGLLSAALVQQAVRIRQEHSQKMRVVGRMAAGVAHDFNNLLAVVEAASHELGGESYDRPAIVRDLFDVSQRGSLMTRRILAFTKPQAEEVRTLSIDDVITSLIPMMNRLMGASIQIETQLDARGARIQASRGAIEQIIMNLAVNAADALPQGGHFIIETHAEEHNRVTIRLTDDGIGMNEATLTRAFHPFFTTKRHGTGLGLATVTDCVQESNGEILAASEPNVGTTLTLRFPCVADFEATPVSEPRATLNYQEGLVLLVDDDSTVRRALRRLIERAGYTVVEAGDGVEAIEHLKNGLVPDVVLTDLQMPNMGGVSLIRTIKRERPETPCIAITGWMEEGEDSPIEAGALKLFHKPVMMESLLLEIAKAIFAKKGQQSALTL